MAFGVSKWPLPCDPRDACFCLAGYAGGAVPPFQYRCSSVGALAPFLDLIPPGILVPFIFKGTSNECNFRIVAGDNAYQLLIFPFGGGPPFPPPPQTTIEWLFDAQNSTTFEVQSGGTSERLPPPIALVPPITTVPLSGPNLLPNPVICTPAAWDAV